MSQSSVGSFSLSCSYSRTGKTPKSGGRSRHNNTLQPIQPGHRKTPSRTPSRLNTTGDRFIPNRSNLNVDVSYYLLTSRDNIENVKADQPTQHDVSVQLDTTSANDTMQRSTALSELLLGDMSSFRIINCRETSTIETPGRNRSAVDGNKTGGKKSSRRVIPSQADKILDAPDVRDDYYLQLLDWSDTNLLAVALSNEVYVWNSDSGDIINLMKVESDDYISSVSWIKGGNQLAIGTSENNVLLYDVAKMKKLRTLRGHEARVSCLSWNNHILSSGSRSGAIHHHDVRIANHLVGSVTRHQGEVCGLQWSPTGKYLASGGNDNSVFVWNSSCSGETSPSPVYTFDKHAAAVKAIGWCPWKPSLLATGGGAADRCLKIWNVSSGENTYTIDTQSQVCSILWAKEYQELISGHGFNTCQLVIWKYPGMSKVQELTGHTRRILSMSMSPDGQTVVSLGADETLRFWDCFQVDKDKKKMDDFSICKENIISNSMSIR